MNTQPDTSTAQEPARPLDPLVRAPYGPKGVNTISYAMTWICASAAAVGMLNGIIHGSEWGWQFNALVGWCYVLWWEAAARRSNDKLMDRLPGASDSEPPVEGGSMQRLARHCPENSQQTKTQNP